jgi:hypothetical protein
MIFRLLLKHILCMSAFIACAQTESTPSLAIQNASTAEKSGTPAALKASTSEVPLPDLKQLNLPPVDVPERTKQTLDHLDLAARHYRAIAAPLQTVGESPPRYARSTATAVQALQVTMPYLEPEPRNRSILQIESV